ncbi:MAG: hypothetical protein J5674_00050 [Candidatus Methanomethylophilaceae archaeon]|nr:hypothetical protein [Candidatus Methanomethylophilaceae archaeon]
MDPSDLVQYAEKAHHIQEHHRRDAFPGCIALVNPDSEKWAAVVIR